jgi:hypothetical protein
MPEKPFRAFEFSLVRGFGADEIINICYQLIGNWTGLEVLPIMARTRSLETEDA